MANDPGRQILEDQIQSSGFLFLEDYFDSIQAGPKRDPIIELVKTPGRRKDAPKKTRAATAAANKAKAIITITLDDDDFDKENEAPAPNAAPINAFHKALLLSKDANGANSSNSGDHSSSEIRSAEKSARPAKPPLSKKKLNSKAKPVVILDPDPERMVVDDEEEDDEIVVERLVTPPHSRTLVSQGHEVAPPRPVVPVSHDTQSAAPIPAQPLNELNELSIIAEDDESAAERSRNSINTAQAPISAPKNADAPAEKEQVSSTLSDKSGNSKYSHKFPFNIDMATVMDLDDFTQTTTFTGSSSTSTQSFQTVALDSPASTTKPTTTSATSEAEPPEPSASHRTEESTTEPLPKSESQVESTSQEHLADTVLSQKPIVPHFPTIGAPSPFRKPRWCRRTATPAAGPSTTRSSWLVKAREAKAVEDHARKAGAPVTVPALASAHHTTLGNKRKSGEMLGLVHDEDVPEHDETGRMQKMTKIAETSPVLAMLKEQDKHPFGRLRDQIEDVKDTDAEIGDGSEGMIKKLKKTVAGFSARAEKSMGKSLGGAAATALAEARAAAEAKIAERHAAEGRVVPSPAAPAPLVTEERKAPIPVFTAPPPEAKRQEESRSSKEADRRLSVSDLNANASSSLRHPHKPRPVTSSKYDDHIAADTSTSTTPPHSPPRARQPVFTLPEKPKPQPMPVFFPPPSQTFSRPEPESFAPSRVPQPLPAHSTFYSTQSTFPDSIFDHETPPWMPFSQDTNFSDPNPLQIEQINDFNRDATDPETDMDADESWHLDDKFGEAWTPVIIGMKDDSMTWSTAPTRSTQGENTDVLDSSIPPLRKKQSIAQEPAEEKTAPVSEALPSDNDPYSDEEDMDVEEYDEDVPGIRHVNAASQSNVNLFSSQTETQSSSNTSGFFSSASKLVSSVLGGSKKGKEPVKSIQLAAAAAKKQQEEADKKVTRLKDMEARRQQALQKKADEEKAREEKKAKEENERWRRDKDKDDTTEKKVLRQPGKKMEDDFTKKRKPAEVEKKTETKKPPSKDKKDAPLTKIGKLFPNNSQSVMNASSAPSKIAKPTASSLVHSTAKPVDPRPLPALKGKGKVKEAELEDNQPSKAMQSQMQTRVHAQLEEVRKVEMPPPAVPSELIELPDINSEYSDSDDENRVRTFDPPHWAQSPELRSALQTQSTVNPDDIFGAIRPLKMEELFKTRTSRFRARTSSANWAGTDELTASEEREYARRMGYTK
ncbi:hypothetical protein DFH11DRAFT_1685640 [Phellopilus nigrolimitatus]|nr:hypothetical protein DFH11DRAFT_1685640 [Phellopilus nigrolimitatus]